MQVKTIKEAIKSLKDNCKDEYAQAYLKALPEVIEEDGKNGLVSQMRYVLANTQRWKGPEASQVKKFVNSWIKKNSKV